MIATAVAVAAAAATVISMVVEGEVEVAATMLTHIHTHTHLCTPVAREDVILTIWRLCHTQAGYARFVLSFAI